MTIVSTNTSFCLSGTILLSPRKTVIGHCSDKDTGISASRISMWSVAKSYEELKKGTHNVKTSDWTFMCPYCPKRIKRDYVYREILEHASGVGRSSSQKRSATEKANHLALMKYLKKDLMNVDGPSKPIDEGDPPVNEASITKFLLLLNVLIGQFKMIFNGTNL